MDTQAHLVEKKIPEHFDPYRLSPEHIQDPPQGLGNIMRRIGPGLVLSASIVGSGELIATTTLGAKVGYVMLWLIIFSCLIKAVVQAVLGRYVILTGETTLVAFSRMPGPRLMVHWFSWAWVAATFMVLFALTGMYIGISQVMYSLVPAIPVAGWVAIFFVLTMVLLLRGAYGRIEKLAVMKVSIFTMLTLLSALLLLNMPQYFSWAQIAEGLRFDVPDAGLAVAIAVFGITGVASGELCIYPYWCIEKGYARFTGPREDSEAWRQRAAGWIRVMHVDVIVSMIVYTIATIAFYLLGAGVLHGMGLVPSGKDMIGVLSRIYTETLGGWSLWLFYLGAIVTLYGTIFAVTAGNSRMFADVVQLAGSYQKDDYARRTRWRDVFIVLMNVFAIAFFFLLGQAPVSMVTWAGMGQAALLPVVAFGTVYLAHRHLPKEMAVPGWMMALLWFAAIIITVFVVPALYLELSKMF
ncbi:MAG: Nramp family divalent metal transporter [Burkholderiales bacterium]|nr:Nramp family divalent metal transporter [Burkholderiales bacterium]